MDRGFGAKGLDIIEFSAKTFLVEKQEAVKGLILGAGGDAAPGESCQETLKFLLAGEFCRRTFDVGTISTQPIAVGFFCAPGQVLTPENVAKPSDGGIRIHVLST